MTAVPRSSQGSAVQLVLSFPSNRAFSRSGLPLAMPEGGRPFKCPTAQTRALFSAQANKPHPFFPIHPPRYTQLSCVCRLCRLRFPAAVSPRLSPFPLPSRPDGLLCGSTESPTPFLCGITMAAGVSLPALALQVTLSDAILYPSGTSRRHRSSGAEWGNLCGL